jgi:hypothetical protein
VKTIPSRDGRRIGGSRFLPETLRRKTLDRCLFEGGKVLALARDRLLGGNPLVRVEGKPRRPGSEWDGGFLCSGNNKFEPSTRRV